MIDLRPLACCGLAACDPYGMHTYGTWLVCALDVRIGRAPAEAGQRSLDWLLRKAAARGVLVGAAAGTALCNTLHFPATLLHGQAALWTTYGKQKQHACRAPGS